MKTPEVLFSGHAIRQLLVRNIAVNDVLMVIQQGVVIAEYPHDKPYPSQLLLGFRDELPIHAVIAHNENEKHHYCYHGVCSRPCTLDGRFQDQEVMMAITCTLCKHGQT